MSARINTSSIVKVFGRLVLIEAAMMVLSLAICVLYGESDWQAFAIAVGVAGLTAFVMEFATRNVTVNLRLREGCILTALVWVVFSLFGMLPFLWCSTPMTVTDAMFETVSGFTTTGASVITDVEACSHGILFWRAFIQWLGGLGIILFMLAIIPALNKNAGISLFNAESTGILHAKIHPRIRQTAISIWSIYAGLTVISVVLLFIGPMNLFDAVCQTMTTLSTGGFVTRNAGMMYWNSDYILWVEIVMMFLGGVNFLLLYGAWKGRFRQMWRNDVFRAYVALVVFIYLFILVNLLLRGQANSLREALIFPLFHVLTAITSSGFGIPGVESWGSAVLGVTLLMMFLGACAGSTTGGMKIDRLVLMRRNVINEAKKMIFPRRTYVVSMNGNTLDSGLVSRIAAFATIYLLFVFASTLIVSMFNYGLDDALFMSTSAIGCSGLGYGATGFEGGYFLLPEPVKWLLTADMLFGRLELFTYIVLLFPAFWHK